MILPLAIAGAVGAFQPTPKAQVKNAKVKKIVSPEVRSGASPTKADMVAIRSPFWHAFDANVPKTEARIDYVVDRDYTVALTLLLVGIWLTMFHPSKCFLVIDFRGGRNVLNLICAFDSVHLHPVYRRLPVHRLPGRSFPPVVWVLHWHANHENSRCLQQGKNMLMSETASG